MITVFTPTYNRENTLARLYESLKEQTYKDFEWLIVDDGSTDSTSSLIQKFQEENIIHIRYYYTSNGGKHRAINLGVKKANGELFFIVDSDDYILPNALDIIWKYWNSIPQKELYSGLTFRKYDIKNKKLCGRKFHEKVFESNHVEVSNIYGDVDYAIIFSKNILKQFPFPEIEDEKFVPEGFMWAQITSSYKMKYIDEIIYFCEYKDDGYTKNFKKNFKTNPKGFRMSYKYTFMNKNYKLEKRMKAFIRIIQSYYYEFLKKE